MLFRSVPSSLVAALGIVALVSAPCNAADVRHAKQSLDAIDGFLADGTPGGLEHANEYVNIIENDLDGVDAPTKAPLMARLEIEKQKIAARYLVVEKARFKGRMDSAMDASRALVSPEQENVRAAFASTPQDLDRADKMLASAEAAKYLDDATQKKLGDELRLIHGKLAEKYMKQNLDYAKSRLESVEGRLPAFLESAKEAEAQQNPAALDSDARSFAGDVNMVDGQIKAMPADNAEVKKLAQRLSVAREAYEVALVHVQGHDVLTDFTNDWEGRFKAAEGWEAERQPITLPDFLTADSAPQAALNMPKSMELFRTANGLLRKFYGVPYPASQPESKETNRAFLRDPKIKSLIGDVTTLRDTAESKILAALTSLVDRAEKIKLPSESVVKFKILIERTLPESVSESPRFIPVVERIKAILAAS